MAETITGFAKKLLKSISAKKIQLAALHFIALEVK